MVDALNSARPKEAKGDLFLERSRDEKINIIVSYGIYTANDASGGILDQL